MCIFVCVGENIHINASAHRGWSVRLPWRYKSPNVGAGAQTQVLRKKSMCSKPWRHLSSPKNLYLIACVFFMLFTVKCKGPNLVCRVKSTALHAVELMSLLEGLASQNTYLKCDCKIVFVTSEAWTVVCLWAAGPLFRILLVTVSHLTCSQFHTDSQPHALLLSG